ncbi:MAG: hypothetical protein ACOXZR_03240 [Bacilli bacterium]|jgi:hypothetical protein
MNKKGFSTVELVVSFIIASLIIAAMYRATLSLNEKLLYHQHLSNITVYIGTLTNNIYEDLIDNIDNPLTGVSDCGEGCFALTFKDSKTKEVKINQENNTFSYDNIVEKLPSDFQFNSSGMSAKIISENMSEDYHDSIFILTVPIISKIYDDKFSIEIVYTYDSRK